MQPDGTLPDTNRPRPEVAAFEVFGAGRFWVFGDNMHKEVTLLPDATGCYALGYSGLSGPYQANRVSYLDFIKALAPYSDPHAGG